MCIGLVCIVLSIIVYRLSIWLYTSPSQVNSKRKLALDCIVVSWDHVEKVILSNDNTQYQVTRLNKQLWVTGLTLMTTETYASFFMCIINIHLDVHFFYYNCYGNCYSFFLKTLNANGLNNYSVHSTFSEFRSNTKCLPLRISLDF